MTQDLEHALAPMCQLKTSLLHPGSRADGTEVDAVIQVGRFAINLKLPNHTSWMFLGANDFYFRGQYDILARGSA